MIEVNFLTKTVTWFDPSIDIISSVTKLELLSKVIEFLQNQAILCSIEFIKNDWNICEKPTILPPQLTQPSNAALFMLKYVDHLMEDLPLDFDERFMNLFQKKIGIFLSSGNIAY